MKVPLLPSAKKPLIFAHRGASAYAPENTMAAFKLAQTLGAPGIELDIHRCASGELVVFHDDTTARLCPGTSYSIIDTQWTTLKTLDIGSWKGSQYRQERPILLAELFEALGTSMYYDIEIKARTTQDRGAEKALADLLAAMHISPEQAVISSFNPIALKRFKAFAPHYATAVIYCKSRELPWYLRNGAGKYIAGCDYLKPEHVDVSKPMLFYNSTLGRYPVVPWTVDDADIARSLVAMGCSGIITNKPDTILKAMQ